MANPLNPALNRRDFLRRSFAFSAAASLAPSSLFARGFTDSPPLDPASQHMFMVGDWGNHKDVGQQIGVAVGMKKIVDGKKFKPGALFMLGDNWYGTLVGGVDSPRWQTQFEQMYPTSHFPGPAYAVLGNHDYEFKVALKADTQLAYAAHAKGTRWTLPAKWYTFTYPQKDPIVTFICLDSNLPGSKGDFFPFTITLSKRERDEQDAWFRAELAKPRTTPFVAVVAHHPIYNNGIHKDNKLLMDDWDALLRQHKVDFYITGHDHDLQHIEIAGHPTSFVISGGGGADLDHWTTPPEKRGPYGGIVAGFTDMEMTPQAVIMRHFNQNGQELHAFRKTPDGKVEILRPAVS